MKKRKDGWVDEGRKRIQGKGRPVGWVLGARTEDWNNLSEF